MERASLVDLEAVIAIARRGTFRAAAIDVGLSTTALSHVIGKLEAKLGVRLFNRTTRSVSLTDAGRLFVEGVGPALQDVYDALETVRSQRATPSGTIRINAAAFAALEIMPLVLEFHRRYPDMNVDLVTEGRLVDIVSNGFDLGVRVAHLIPSDMIAVSLGLTQRHVVVGSPDYFKTQEKPRVPMDLLKHECVRIRLPDGSPYLWHFEKQGNSVQVDVSGRITVDEGNLARLAVIENAGLGYTLEQYVREDIAAGRLVRVLEDWTPQYPGLCLYYPGRRNLSAGMKAFLSLARESGEKGKAEPVR